MTTAALMGTGLVKIILCLVALGLYVKLMAWTGRKLAEAGERQRKLADLELLYVAACKWIAARDAKSLKTREYKDCPFSLDFPDDVENDDLLLRRLEKSVELTRRPNDAA